MDISTTYKFSGEGFTITATHKEEACAVLMIEDTEEKVVIQMDDDEIESLIKILRRCLTTSAS